MNGKESFNVSCKGTGKGNTYRMLKGLENNTINDKEI